MKNYNSGLSKENSPGLDSSLTIKNRGENQISLWNSQELITPLYNFSTKDKQAGFSSQLLNNIAPPKKKES